jgi:hypothetical protein
VLSAAAGQQEALTAMVQVCRWNTFISSLSFPPLLEVDKAAIGRIAEVWAMIGEALWSNPRPLFTSLNFYKSYLGDVGLDQMLPALDRLFSSNQRALAPVALSFEECELTARGVANILGLLSSDFVSLNSLQQLSIGRNPWVSQGDAGLHVDRLVSVLRKASLLRVLNVESSVGGYPMAVLSEALCASACPLMVIKLAGSPVPPQLVS